MIGAMKASAVRVGSDRESIIRLDEMAACKQTVSFDQKAQGGMPV
jgi:hypothetical protein